jgi:hypothetical protein
MRGVDVNQIMHFEGVLVLISQRFISKCLAIGGKLDAIF